MLRRILVVGGSGAVGALTLALVQIRVGALFGAGGELDAYFVGAALPSILLAVSSGTIAYLIVPRLPLDDAAEASRITGRLAGTAVLAGSALTLLVVVAAPLIVELIAPGFDDRTAEDAVSVLRLYSLTIPPTVAAFVISALGHNLNRGYAVGASTAIYGLVWTGLLFIEPFTNSALDVVLAGLIATGVQLLSADLLAAPRGLRPHVTFRGIEWPARGALVSATTVLGAIVLGRLVLLFDPLFGSLLKDGAVSQLTYATRVLTLAVFAAGQGAAFSLLVVSRREHAEGSADVRIGVVTSLLLALAAASLFAVAGPALAELLLAHGEFSSADAREVGELLRLYGPAVVVMTAIWGFEAMLYATFRGSVVLRAAAIGLVVNALASALLVAVIGIEGRPLGVLVGYTAQLAYLVPLLRTETRLAMLRSPRTYALLFGALILQSAAAALVYLATDTLAGSGAAAVAAMLAAGAVTLPLVVVYERRALAGPPPPAAPGS